MATGNWVSDLVCPSSRDESGKLSRHSHTQFAILHLPFVIWLAQPITHLFIVKCIFFFTERLQSAFLYFPNILIPNNFIKFLVHIIFICLTDPWFISFQFHSISIVYLFFTDFPSIFPRFSFVFDAFLFAPALLICAQRIRNKLLSCHLYS